jgi:hypothetical protein
MRTNKQSTTIGDKHVNITNQTITMGDKHMNNNRQNATIVGILFILATVSAILGLYFYQPILSGADYLMNGAAYKNQIALGVLMELILVCTAIGTAIALFPVLKPYGERIALGHLFFRFLEASVILTGIVAVLSLSTLSQAFVAANAPDATVFHTLGSLLHAVYKWTSMLGPLFFLGVNTLMYSYLLYKSKLVPRWLAVFGLISATTVFCAALVVLSGIAIQLSAPVVLMAMPIFFFEMVFAGWLIVKGFNSSAITSESVKTEARTILNTA